MPAPPTSDLDLSVPDFQKNAYAIYAEMLKMAPVYFLSRHNQFLVLGYQEVREVLTNPEVFSSKLNSSFDPVLLGADPPVHSHRRRILEGHSGPFSKHRIEKLDGLIRRIAVEILKDIGGEEFDLINDFAAVLPSYVILEYLGFPLEKAKEIRNWTQEAVSNSTIHDFNFSEVHWQKLKPFLTRFLSSQESELANSVLREIQEDPEWQRHTSREDLVKLTKILLVGGNETTPNLIGSIVLSLINGKMSIRELRTAPDLIDRLIAETLRHQSPTHLVHRICVQDYQLGENEIPAGAVLAVGVGLANRDPNIFPAPETFDLSRNQAKSIPFGAGPHYCIGAQLSLLETRIALEELFRKFDHLELRMKPDELEYRPSSHVRGLVRLIVKGTQSS